MKDLKLKKKEFFDRLGVEIPDLRLLNIKRGIKLRLPSGQRIAKFMGEKQLKVKVKNFPKKYKKNTPLWLYILYEAQKQNNGLKLGKVGGRIVAEVLIGLILADKDSFLIRKPDWHPERFSDITGMLKYAGVYDVNFID